MEEPTPQEVLDALSDTFNPSDEWPILLDSGKAFYEWKYSAVPIKILNEELDKIRTHLNGKALSDD